MRIRPLRALVATAICLATVVGGPQPALAGTTDPAVLAYLAANPGGELLPDHEISYDKGTFIVAVTRSRGVAGTADCPRGWFCFYDNPNYNYPRGRLSSCYWQDLATWQWDSRTESVDYALDSGSVLFLNNTSGLFRIGIGYPMRLSSVQPNQNLATRVYRYC